MRLHRSGRNVFVLRDTEMAEQRFIGKVHGLHPDSFEKNAGENVQTNRPVIKFVGNAAFSAEKI